MPISTVTHSIRRTMKSPTKTAPLPLPLPLPHEGLPPTSTTTSTTTTTSTVETSAKTAAPTNTVPPVYIFAYGSLINGASVRRSITAPVAVAPKPVVVSGFRRTWGFKCARRSYTAVAITASASANDCVNGVLVRVNNDDLPNLDKREEGYARRRICSSLIRQPYGNVHIEPHAQIWAYILEDCCEAESGYESDSSISSTRSHVACPVVPIPQSYIDCIIAGALLEHGPRFARDFIRLTHSWHEGTWINDRNAKDPVRRYVPNAAVGENDLCPKVAKSVDDLLQALVPSAFSSRIDVA
ncbi:hypothetical protein BCR33DRAFT_208065 [Rhizoclosmatium globosum]|uniref:Gamma-glutamylcyclotransferase AIG2-like domain-containing protein n=1 Tax=Rhizoclosmatium globosum TaxID=329046 RepID=A0A1Y2CEM2_9FUNG|nr:hypothetical protein BCR33DRAFT_208065 [Rhizoclosmatium globosum]|eukprot:ORY44745.1 hypothetical protein BCR33DRAFT_208065 [Rhizoclosmatium globosum]